MDIIKLDTPIQYKMYDGSEDIVRFATRPWLLSPEYLREIGSTWKTAKDVHFLNELLGQILRYQFPFMFDHNNVPVECSHNGYDIRIQVENDTLREYIIKYRGEELIKWIL